MSAIRRIVDFLTGLSLVFVGATILLWVHSYHRIDSLSCKNTIGSVHIASWWGTIAVLCSSDPHLLHGDMADGPNSVNFRSVSTAKGLDIVPDILIASGYASTHLKIPAVLRIDRGDARGTNRGLAPYLVVGISDWFLALLFAALPAFSFAVINRRRRSRRGRAPSNPSLKSRER